MRSLRLSLAEIFRIPQEKVLNRILLCLPLTAVIALLLWWSNRDAASFNHLWNYFAWGNQVLAACTLAAGAVWLWKQGKNGLIAWIPGAFITFVVLTYILWISPAHKGPFGFGLELDHACILAGAGVLMITLFLLEKVRNAGKGE